MKKLPSLIFLFFLVCSIRLSALEPAVYSLAELVDIALRNNPDTKKAWSDSLQAAAAYGSAKSSYYPNLSIDSNLSHGRTYKFVNGPETPYSIANADLTMSYLLLDFGERNANEEAARAAWAFVDSQNERIFQRIVYSVILNAYDYLLQKELLDSRLGDLKDAETTFESTEELSKAGLRSVTDLFSIKATIADLKISIALQKAETEIARLRLASSLGLNGDAPLCLKPLPSPQPSFIEDSDHLIEIALQKRADLMALRAQTDQQNAIVASTKARYLPKVNFTGNTGWEHYFNDKSGGYHYRTSLNLNIPLFDGFEAASQKQMAFSRAQYAQADLEQLELDVALEVASLARQLEAAREILELTKVNLSNSSESYEGVFDKYKAGSQSIFEITAAQNQLGDARLKQIEAKIRWYRTLAQLAYATGTIIHHTEVPCVVSE